MEDLHEATPHEKSSGEDDKSWLATVSHEMCTPLSCIRGAIRTVASGAAGPISPEAQKLLEIAEHHGERLNRLVDEILQLETMGWVAMHRDPIDLSELIAHAVAAHQSLAGTREVELFLDEMSVMAYVEGDAGRLHQLFSNLLSNAIKVSPTSGEIHVGIERVPGRLRVSIRDEGPGIEESFREKIFEPFSREASGHNRKRPGVGLGLNIARRIVIDHGGDIYFDSEPGKGATFFVELPEITLS
ncbi:MAG: sensor histidine kinase [Bradymonadaceae bacterium]